jgi:hypothetical protein
MPRQVSVVIVRRAGSFEHTAGGIISVTVFRDKTMAERYEKRQALRDSWEVTGDEVDPEDGRYADTFTAEIY